jgi:hypothetical protein
MNEPTIAVCQKGSLDVVRPPDDVATVDSEHALTWDVVLSPHMVDSCVQALAPCLVNK